MRFGFCGGVIVFMLAFLPLRAAASFTSGDVGTSGAQFLKLGGGARGEAMGEAQAAVADQGDAIYWNPAALGRLEESQATLTHTALPAGINYEFAAAAYRFRSEQGIGASVQYLSQPGIDQTDSEGFTTGSTFKPSDFALTVGYGATIHSENLGVFDGSSFGASLKYVSDTITHTVYTYAGDVGIVTAPFSVLGCDTRLAYAAQNIGGTLKFDTTADSLPTILRFGSSLEYSRSLLFALDLDETLDNHPFVAMGVEYRYYVDEAMFAARAGLNTLALGDAGDWSGLTAGVGAKFSRINFDYALAPLGALGIVHRISVSLSF